MAYNIAKEKYCSTKVDVTLFVTLKNTKTESTFVIACVHFRGFPDLGSDPSLDRNWNSMSENGMKIRTIDSTNVRTDFRQ